MKSSSFVLGALFAFFIQYKFNIVKSSLPGGQLWVYKHKESPDSLLYIFSGTFREYNWQMVLRLMEEAARRGDSDFHSFDPSSLIVRDYPEE
jgi:hypothetical protein